MSWLHWALFQKSLRKERFQDTFPKDKIWFSTFWCWINWWRNPEGWFSLVCLAGELGELLFSLGKILGVLFPPSLAAHPKSWGSPCQGSGIPFLGSVSLEITTRELQLEQELPWMSQDFWAWSSVNCHVLLFITICGKILSFNEKKPTKKTKKKLILLSRLFPIRINSRVWCQPHWEQI